MALSAAQIQQLVQSGALTPQTAAQLGGVTPQIDPTRLNQAFGLPQQAPPEAPQAPPQLGTGMGYDLSQQLIGNVRAQAGLPETIAVSPDQLVRPPAQPSRPAPTVPRGAGKPGKAAPTPKSIAAEYEANVMGTFGEQQRNIEAQRDLAAKQALDNAIGLQVANEQMDAADAQLQAERQQRITASAAALDDLNRSSQAIGEYREDPNRLWHNMGSGQQVLAGIALLASALGGKQGEAMGALQGAMDRDVAAQRSAYMAQKDKVTAKQNAYSMLMQRYHDEDSAAQALKVMQYDQASRRLGMMAAGSQNQQVQLQAAQALTALKAQRDQAANAFAMQRYKLTTGAGVAGGLPKVLKNIYVTPEATKEAYIRYLQEEPKGSYEDFVSRAAQANRGSLMGGGRGGGGEPATLTRQIAKTETGRAAVERAAELQGAKPDQSWFSAQVIRAANTIDDVAGSKIFGTSQPYEREIARSTAQHEAAIVLEMGSAADSTKEEVAGLLRSNDPRKWQAARKIISAQADVEYKAIKKAVKERKAGTNSLEDDVDSMGGGRGR